MKVNAQYNIARPESLPSRIASYQRYKMYNAFLKAVRFTEEDSVIDVGVTSDQSYGHSNYFEARYPHKSRITATGLDDAQFLQQQYPGVRFIQADGCKLPFRDRSFDYAHSSAVIEHVGSYDRQIHFLGELWRIARKGIFVTTPNRWFPIEFHTVLPLMHWLPPPAFRNVLRHLDRDFFAREENLNLLSSRKLSEAARHAGMKRFQIGSVTLFGWPTNLLLTAVKD